jgi:hypothetical protein
MHNPIIKRCPTHQNDNESLDRLDDPSLSYRLGGGNQTLTEKISTVYAKIVRFLIFCSLNFYKRLSMVIGRSRTRRSVAW